MSAASPLLTSDQLRAPAFFTRSPVMAVCMKSSTTTLDPGPGRMFLWYHEPRPMKRTVALSLLLSAAVMALVLAWNSARQDRQFRRLIAEADAALAAGRTFLAIESFSGR